jgi:tetratricopeptide (TPR) repeat protein
MGTKPMRFLWALVILCAVLAGTATGDDYLDFYEQGEFALRVEKWERAIDLFTRSIEQNANFYLTYHNRAIAYSKMGEYDKSILDLQKAVQLNPNYPEAYGLMGLVYEIQKNYPSALKAYQEALTREKRPVVRRNLEKYIQDVETKIKKK